MTNEQILEELKKLKMHTVPVKGEEKDYSEELVEIDASIEDYNEKIAELETKLADESNYVYDNENEERDLTIELLEESFENQLEVMAREDEEYKSMQELATSIFSDYNLEIAQLNNDIAVIERRLRKNDIAVRKNIGIQLTEDELFNLNLDLEYKKARIKECEEMKEKYVEDLRNYGELITANNRKKEVVLAKQESLNKIKEHRASKEGSLDHAKIRIDKDELASLKSGVAALEARRDYITYNPNERIDNLISAIENNKVQDVSAVVGDDSNKENSSYDADNLDTDKEDTNKYDKAQALIDAYLDNGEEELNNDDRIFTGEERNLYGNNDVPLGIPSETTAHDLWLSQNSDLDEEREADIEEAEEILKETKKEGWFKRNWKRWVAAGVAAVALLLAMKGCNSNTNTNKPVVPENNNISYSQTDDGIVDENKDEFDEKYEVPGEGNLDDTEVDNSDDIVPNPDTDVDVDNDIDTDTDVEVDNDIDIDNDVEVENDVDTDNDIEDDKVSDTTDSTEEVELEQGESIISAEDLINGDINEDTVIEHGDEVGKTAGNSEVIDYTDDGKVVVDVENNTEEVDETFETDHTKEDIISNLEEFLGGDISLTEEGEKWLDEVSGGKHVRR